MIMGELKELFYHWYVPEFDYKSPLSEMDKWSIFVNVSLSVALIVGVLLFGLFCKLKHRWLVNAKCAFCKCVVKVWTASLHWWFCNHCQRINGYPKDSFVQTDSSTEESQGMKDDSLKLNIRNNKIPSPSNQRTRLVYSKNDLNELSTIISHSPKVFQDNEIDVTKSILHEDGNVTQIESSFQKIRNKIKGLLECDRAKLDNNATTECSTDLNGNPTQLPVEMSDLRKMHLKLILDDVNRRFELLNAEKALCDKIKQMKKEQKSIRHEKENAARDREYYPKENENKTYTHSMRRRNTFFERTLDHSMTSPVMLNSNNKEINLKKNDTTSGLATLEAQLSELRDMHANELAMLQSQIDNKTKILEKLESLKFGVQEKVRDDYDRFDFYQKQKAPQSNSTQKLNQILPSDSESGHQSEHEGTKNQVANKDEMSVIIEEGDSNPEYIPMSHRDEILKKTIDHRRKDTKEASDDDEYKLHAPILPKRRSSTRIVKPIRGGQRPETVTKVVLSSTQQ